MRYQVYVAEKNDILFIEKGYKDVTRALSQQVTYYFFNFKTLEPLKFSDIFPHIVKTVGSAAFEQKFRSVLAECGTDFSYSHVKCFETAYSIFSQIMYESANKSNYFGKYLRIQNAMYTIETDFSDSRLSVIDLAKKCDMSTSTLNRYFKEMFRQGPSALLRKKRMENAQYLILRGIGNIGELAERCGYQDI